MASVPQLSDSSAPVAMTSVTKVESCSCFLYDALDDDHYGKMVLVAAAQKMIPDMER